MVKCRECGSDFNDDKELNSHIKSHKIKIDQYYEKHFPKFDLLTGKKLLFKNKETYFEVDFESIPNFKKWIKTAPTETVKKYIEDFIIKRKEKKAPVYPFSEVEMRSLKFLRIYQMNEFIGDYYDFCEKIGFERKFSFPQNIMLNDVFPENDSSVILIDTREQKPFSFSIPTQVKKLDFGDYVLKRNESVGSTCVERKNLVDFIGTLNAGYDRFCREIERAMENSCDIVVVVECDLTTALTFNYLPYITRNTKVNPAFIFHRVRTILNSYGNIQFLFVEGKNEAAKIVEKIFLNEGISKKYDLQLMHEIKLL